MKWEEKTESFPTLLSALPLPGINEEHVLCGL